MLDRCINGGYGQLPMEPSPFGAAMVMRNRVMLRRFLHLFYS
jgi:hypothetical protein